MKNETLTKAPSSIVTDSRQAGRKTSFSRWRQKTDRHKYIPDVLQKGALAVLCEEARGARRSHASLCRIRSQPCSRSPRQAEALGLFRLSASPAASAAGLTAKEMLAAAYFLRENEVFKRQGSMNGQIGIPFIMACTEV